MGPTRNDLITTAYALVNSYRTWTMDAIMSLRSTDCIHRILPASRKQPPRSNEDYRAFFSTMIPVFQDFTPSIKEEETLVDEESRKVAMHIQSHATTAFGDYDNEYMFIVKTTEKGDKVQEIWEFVDSAASNAFFPKLSQKQVP
ncbi:MAG: hypothetical protein LQ340_006538 [Diploschistes diacapsis]|nr:MAG: hypothetical protein LQ340_006538 [Diploschistes diacapsis]